MDTERVLRTTGDELTQEDHLTVNFLDRDVVVLDSWEVLLHLVELMIVRGEERTGVGMLVFVKIFHDGPGDRDAVVGGRAASKLVEEYERTG